MEYPIFRGKRKDIDEWIESSLIQVYSNGVLLGELDKDVAAQVNDGSPEILRDYVRWYPVKPETLCQALTYCTFDVNDDTERRPIFDKDLVEITFPGGDKRRYAVWYMGEGSCFKATPWDEEDVENDDAMFVNYPINFKHDIKWDDFVLMVQDPYGEITSVKVIGNYVDNPELFFPAASKKPSKATATTEHRDDATGEWVFNF